MIELRSSASGAMTRRGPSLSVIVPVHNGATYLRSSLAALAASSLARTEWELIVVSDASLDGSELLAALHADTVVRLPAVPRGPGYARNRGADVAHGDILVFVDSDVAVQADTLKLIHELFAAKPGISAFYGSYDANPPAAGLVSQYVNLRWHHRLQGEPRFVESFWTGCGAVRRAAFAEVGGFDEWQFRRAQVEDVDLGHRLGVRGHTILLDPAVQVTHLKSWTVRRAVRTDYCDRWVPWLRMAARRGGRRQLPWPFWSIADTAGAIGTAGTVAAAAAWVAGGEVGWLALAAAAAVVGLAAQGDLLAALVRLRGVRFAIAALPLHMLLLLVNGAAFATGTFLAALLGEPRPEPIVEAFAEVGLATWPPLPIRADAGGIPAEAGIPAAPVLPPTRTPSAAQA